MNWREQVSVSIPCFGIRFIAVLYITNAPSIQMIHPREDAGSLSREYVFRIPSVS